MAVGNRGTGNRRDRAVPGDFANHLIPGIGVIDIAVGVERYSAGPAKLCRNGGAAIAGIAKPAVSSETDHLTGGVDLEKAILRQKIHIAGGAGRYRGDNSDPSRGGSCAQWGRAAARHGRNHVLLSGSGGRKHNGRQETGE